MMNAVPIRVSARPPAPAPAAQPPPPVERGLGNGLDGVIALRPPQGMYHPKVQAIVFAIGAILAGLVAWLIGAGIELMFSIWGSKPTGLPALFGLIIAVPGVVVAIVAYHPEDARPHVQVGEGVASLALPGFRKPLIVSRENVRVVAIDPAPLQLFHNNKRFPISDPLPSEVFADALDRPYRDPWDPGNAPGSYDASAPPVTPPMRAHQPLPARWQPPIADIVPGGGQGSEPPAWLKAEAAALAGDSPPVPPGSPAASPAASPAENRAEPHRDHPDDQPGWAAAGSRPAPPAAGIRGYLYSGDGSALPVSAANPADLPNVAIIFNHPVILPKRALRLSPWCSAIRTTRATRVAGLMVAARNPDDAAVEFGRWGVVRPVTADDVLDGQLRPPKPLTGWRAAIFALILLAPVVIKLLSKLF